MNDKTFADKARQNLTVAEWCFDNGHYDACCNRAYYAMFQAALAALIHERINPSGDVISHTWVHSNFATYFCNQRKIFPRFREYLPNAQIVRNHADYKPALMSRRHTQQQFKESRDFVKTLLERIKSQ